MSEVWEETKRLAFVVVCGLLLVTVAGQSAAYPSGFALAGAHFLPGEDAPHLALTLSLDGARATGQLGGVRGATLTLDEAAWVQTGNATARVRLLDMETPGALRFDLLDLSGTVVAHLDSPGQEAPAQSGARLRISLILPDYARATTHFVLALE